ncbi:surface protease GP63, putative [Trypanosoma cruzi marinkellei]|uniref:Leishmanolysin-like peptidase n=1 Tax=Trypanosoma cruzi marinkellei TaxID=85056 RepID=K2NMQ5_TRYCR|nr:surface protease GP63, putative [Trypanosoma cruzi marinkellei]
MMCCASGCLAADPAMQHRCGLDEVMKYGSLPTAVVREVPRRGQAAVQAYTVATQDADSEWAPIRIKVSARDLYNQSKHCTAARETRTNYNGNQITCASRDVLTEEKRDVLLRQILPAAIKLHTDRISVKPVKGPIRIPQTRVRICDKFVIPRSHYTVGVSNADLVIYLGALPRPQADGWASICAKLEDGRPFASAVNLAPGGIKATNGFVRIAAHELGHALGFSYHPLSYLRMLSDLTNVRGVKVLMVSSPKVKEMAQKHYNCSTLQGAELENEGDWGGRWSHWEERNLRDELMTSGSGIGYYSALTLAAFEDMGFYKANYSMAEPLRWGNNSGCGLLEKKCLINGTTDYPELFCNQPTDKHTKLCTYDRLSLGHCSLKMYAQPLPPQYQYFTSPRLGSNRLLTDKCPMVEAYSNSGCTSGTRAFMPGSFVGPNSRCAKGDVLRFDGKYIGDVCVNTRCEDGNLSVQFLHDEKWYECRDGATVTPNETYWSGGIFCPKYADVCTALPNVSGYPIPVLDAPLTDDPKSPEDAEEEAENAEGKAENDKADSTATSSSTDAKGKAENDKTDSTATSSSTDAEVKAESAGFVPPPSTNLPGNVDEPGLGIVDGSASAVVVRFRPLLLLAVAAAAVTMVPP